MIASQGARVGRLEPVDLRRGAEAVRRVIWRLWDSVGVEAARLRAHGQAAGEGAVEVELDLRGHRLGQRAVRRRLALQPRVYARPGL